MKQSAFRFPDFRKLVGARFLFSISTQLQAVVMGWMGFEIKRDPLYLGLIGLVEAVPALSLALYAGYLVDRSNPLRIYKNVLRMSFISALILFILSLQGESITSDHRLFIIYSAELLLQFLFLGILWTWEDKLLCSLFITSRNDGVIQTQYFISFSACNGSG